ncbi:MAG TPA: type II secretion system F family protein [Thiobacillus sp.]|nr:MAG: type II secretion system protein [Hydrogenophilales bacterium 28-61-11]OYZ56330.1 MAG: type II secretion system protein [Hydrogenophilales bacterium 16-61-112]OZA45733.1 MAG: type II secretion system protein [Hydrogenophilales bacterium 17-61-76]HQT31220.1 type II secretion system F family protein [Thiobacillus sp.]HQT72043.1 type II secretion system F family protein [Thiobacillus sp.]
MRYRVKALRPGTGVMALTVEALDESEVTARLHREGAQVLSITAERGGWLATRRARFPLLLFTQELIALLDAGLTLTESLETLAEKESRPESRQLIERLLTTMREGRPFSAALAAQGEAFPPLYAATVRAAESTGDLAPALGRYVGYQNQIDTVKKKVLSASIYPMLLVGVGTLVIGFLLAYVVPRFATVYADSGRDLPWMSQMLLRWGELVEAHGGLIALGVVGFVATIVLALSQPATRAALTRLAWRTPAIGEHLRTFELARFYRSLGMLLVGGIPIVQALGMVSSLLSAHLRLGATTAADAMRRGETISAAFARGELTTPVAARLLRVGEKSGRMGEMMERIAIFHDEEMARWVDWFTRLFEPLLMVFIGLTIGLIVVLLYMPIFELAGSIE